MTSTQLARQTEEFVLVPFQNEQTGEQDHVRTIVTPWGVWGIAQDWARALGYGTTSAMLKHVPDGARTKKKMRTEGGLQSMVIISETGMNLAAMHSRTIASRKWQHWLAEEVIPEIRRTGSYQGASKTEAPSIEAAPSTEVALGSIDLASMLEMAAAQIRKETTARLAAEAKVETVTRELRAVEAAVDAWESPQYPSGSLSVNDAAKWFTSTGLYEIGQHGLFAHLRSIGWVFDSNPKPKQYAIKHGFAAMFTKELSNGRIVFGTLITQKGLIHLHKTLTAQATQAIGSELVAA